MSYSVNVFTNWVSNFQSWDALKSWLTSAEGGSLRVVEPRDSPYAIVRYNKGTSNMKLDHVPWCRSVVVQKETRLPVCVAPPKALSLTDESVNEAEVAEEFVDGTMLNIFNLKDDEAVHLTTRSRLNANSRFYADGPSFAEMLQDALTENSFEGPVDLLPSFDEGAVARFTSTVVQHPKNRIVSQVKGANVLVVHQGCVSADGVVQMYENPDDFDIAEVEYKEECVEIQGYKLEPLRAAKSVKEWVNKQAQERGYGWQGVVLKDGKGKRWRVRSDQYETVRRIRGNESTNEERFARLRKTRTKDQYLVFYPEDQEAFYALEGRLRKNTRNLSHFYNDVFRGRTTPYHQLPWPYKHHVSVLHNLYKDTLRAQKKKVDLDEVIRYVNGLNLEDTANMLKEHNLALKKDEPKAETAAAAAEPPAPGTEDEVAA